MLSALGDLEPTPQFCYRILEWELRGHHRVVIHPKVGIVVAGSRSSPGCLVQRMISQIGPCTLQNWNPCGLHCRLCPSSFKHTPRNLKNYMYLCSFQVGEMASLPIIYRHVCVRLSSVSGLGGRPRMGGRFMCRPEMASDHDFNHQRIRLARTCNLIFLAYY